MSTSRSALARSIQPRYDVAIVGGGGYGAWLAALTAAAGLRVLVAERRDFASGSSDNHLRTLHSGLRSLKSGNLITAWRCLRGVAAWQAIAPDLVHPVACQVQTASRFEHMLTAAGAFAYQFLSLGRTRLPERLQRKEPHPHLRDASGRMPSWQEWQIDDPHNACMRLLMSAQRRGADLRNYMEVRSIEAAGRAHRLTLHDQQTQHQSDCEADFVLDCRGDNRSLGEPNDLVTSVWGVNLVLRQSGSRRLIGFKSCSERFLFLSTQPRASLLGTWYFDERPLLNTGFIQQLLEDAYAAGLSRDVSVHDVTRVHVGALAARPGCSEAEGRLRDEMLIRRASGSANWWVIGGPKFVLAPTAAYQAMAKIWPELKVTRPADLVHAASRDLSDALTEPVRLRLQQRMACETDLISQLVLQNATLALPLQGSRDICGAEVTHALREQHCHHLEDLTRRIGIAEHGLPSQEIIAACLGFHAQLHEWSSQRSNAEVERLTDSYIRRQENA